MDFVNNAAGRTRYSMCAELRPNDKHQGTRGCATPRQRRRQAPERREHATLIARLREWLVIFRPNGVISREPSDIVDDADDCFPGIQRSEAHAAPDWTHVRPIPLGHFPIDDHHRRGPRGVECRELPAAEDPNAHGSKKRGPDSAEQRWIKVARG